MRPAARATSAALNAATTAHAPRPFSAEEAEELHGHLIDDKADCR